MRSPKHVYLCTAAVCLLSVAFVTSNLKTPASVQASSNIGRVGAKMQPMRKPVLPPVEEFTLTPPNPQLNNYKTNLSVRFRGLQAETLGAQIPMTLGTQSVLLQRSADNARVFTTSVDFDWESFAKEQQQRKDLAEHGKQVPVFEGRRFIRMEEMQYVDPAEIRNAVKSNQPIQFSGDVVMGGTATVFPNLELMVTAISVVEDTGPSGTNGRTYDPCLPAGQQGNPNGAWTFATLMMAIANTTNVQTAERMLNTMLTDMQTTQTVNSFTVQPRPLIGALASGGNPGSGLLGNWPLDGNLPSLLNAPVRLNAIVNRIDLGQNFAPATAGELRFVFQVTAGTSSNQFCASSPAPAPFNIILEYNVPSAYTPTAWANLWNGLTNTGVLDYDAALQSQITDNVVKAGACGASTSCLAQIRTNEFELDPSVTWELREFHLAQLNNGGRVLQQATVAMTPDGSFNFGDPHCNGNCTAGTVNSWITPNETTIIDSGGALPFIPATFLGSPFLGGSAFNPDAGGAFWRDSQLLTDPNGPTARVYFSANTCNGCHGRETNTAFVQVAPRPITQPGSPDQPSSLSNFLLGCQNNSDDCSPGNVENPQCSLSTPNLSCQESVPDPTGNGNFTEFGDIARRVGILSSLVNTTPRSGGLLLSLVNQPVGVH
jgi:hypothetical protein